MRTFSTLTAAMLSLLFALPTWAHIQLQSPTARYKQDNNGLKDGPCGSGTASNVVTPLVPGQNLTVTWKESISHAGHYRIALSANDTDFTEPDSLTVPTTLPEWDLADGIQDKTGTQTYNQVVKIPDKECPACVLQLLQVMSTGTDGTNTGPFSGVYHACADVSILATNTTADAGAGAGSDARVDARRMDARGSDAMAAAGGSPGTGGSSGEGGAMGEGGQGGHDMGGSMGSGGNGMAMGGSSSGGAGAGGAEAGGASGDGTGGRSDGSGGTKATSGGTSGGKGGTTGSSGGQSGTGGSHGNGGSAGAETGASAGCSCHVGARRPSTKGTLGVWAALVLGVALARLGRRRRRL
jgi:hypothetical protein